ncbi:hypothetical protein ES708_29468 [subsurface metagenome]
MPFKLTRTLIQEVRYPTVDTYADLPLAGNHTGEIYIVLTATGEIFVNHKRAGLYRSDGAAWTRLGEVVVAGAEGPSPGLLPSNPPSGKYVVTNTYFDLEAKEHVAEYNPTPRE